MAGDLERFKSTLVYEKQGTAEELLADVQLLQDFDKRSEGKVKNYKWFTLVSVLVMFGGIGLTVLTSRPICLLLVPLGLIGTIASGVLWAMGSKFDLANKRYELLGELVRLLSRDMAKDARFTTALDLAPANHARKKTTEGVAADWKVTYFVDPWLKLAGRFADGTSFQIALTDKFQARGKVEAVAEWQKQMEGEEQDRNAGFGSIVSQTKKLQEYFGGFE